jgi:hypothetical protein
MSANFDTTDFYDPCAGVRCDSTTFALKVALYTICQPVARHGDCSGRHDVVAFHTFQPLQNTVPVVFMIVSIIIKAYDMGIFF